MNDSRLSQSSKKSYRSVRSGSYSSRSLRIRSRSAGSNSQFRIAARSYTKKESDARSELSMKSVDKSRKL